MAPAPPSDAEGLAHRLEHAVGMAHLVLNPKKWQRAQTEVS